MTKLDIAQPELVGRKDEFSRLCQLLDRASAGQGSMVYISGEAGIGKTRLVNELMDIAQQKNAQIIQGFCLAESLEPLMPIKTALREAGLFHLISGDPPPLVVSAYLMNDAGILLAKSEKEELNLDPYIFASMLKAVGNFVKDSMQMIDKIERSGGLNSLGYKEYRILIEEMGGLHMACVTKGSLSEFLVNDMRQSLSDVNKGYGTILKDWDGDLDKVKGIENVVSKIVTSGRYNGQFLVDDPELRRENLFDNVLLGLQRLSANRPLLIFLDDLQWADPTSLALMHYLAKNLIDHKVMILGTYRPEDIVRSWEGKTHQLETAMQNMNREGLLEKIEIKRLDLTGSKAVVHSVLGTMEFDEKVTERIYKETDGNPFFILEVLKLLTEEGAICKSKQGTWKLVTEVEKLNIPSKVYDVVKRRLDRLMEEQRRILDCASVVGDEFTSDIVGKVANISKIQLLENLSKIEKTHKLVHYLKDKYRFDHAKVRDVLYNGLGEELRREYHRLIADTIAELHKDNPNEVAGELAYHYNEAEDEKAIKFLLFIGREAYLDMSLEESNRVYLTAYEKSTELNNKIEALIGLIEIHIYYENLNLLEAELQEALSLIKDCKDKKLEAKLLVHMGVVERFKGFVDEARKLTEKSLQISKEINDIEGMGRAYSYLAAGAFSHSNYELALDYLKNSLNIEKDRSENMDFVVSHYRRIGTINQAKGDYTTALEYYIKCREMYEKLGDKRRLTDILASIAEIAEIRGERKDTIELHEKILNIFTQMGKEHDADNIIHTKARLAVFRGDEVNAIKYYEKYRELCEKNKDWIGVIHYYKMVSLIFLEKGDYKKALSFAEQGLDLAIKLGDKFHMQSRLQHVAEIYYFIMDYNKALHYCQESLEIAQSLKAYKRTVLSHCKLAEILLEMEETDKAFVNARSALTLAKEKGIKLEEGISHRVLGMVYREKGDFELASEEFQQATNIFISMSVKSELARVNFERAILFKAKGEPIKAKEYLVKALSEFERMGMKLWIEKCKKALEEINK